MRLRLCTKADGQHELLAVARGYREEFPLRPGLSRAVAEAVFADARTVRILETWARSPDDKLQVSAVIVRLQMLIDELACKHHGVEPEYPDDGPAFLDELPSDAPLPSRVTLPR